MDGAWTGLEEHGSGHAVEDEIADQGGERGGAVGLTGEADRHAHGEQQREMVEEGAAGGGHDPGHGQQPGQGAAQAVLAEQVVLTEPEEQAGRGEHRDGHHQGTADPLQHRERG